MVITHDTALSCMRRQQHACRRCLAQAFEIHGLDYAAYLPTVTPVYARSVKEPGPRHILRYRRPRLRHTSKRVVQRVVKVLYIRQAYTEEFTPLHWEYMQRLTGYRCVYCGKKPWRLTKDHVIPVSAGGRTCWENIVPACYECNTAKRAGPPPSSYQMLLKLW